MCDFNDKKPELSLILKMFLSLEAGIIVEFVVNFNDKKPELSLIFGYVLFADEQPEL